MGRARFTLHLSLVVAGLSLVAAPLATAGHIPSKGEDTASAARARDLQGVKDVLAREEVGRALAAHGLSTGEVAQRLDRLSDEDLASLAANVDQIQAAGDVPKYIWILLAIFLAVSIIVLIV